MAVCVLDLLGCSSKLAAQKKGVMIIYRCSPKTAEVTMHVSAEVKWKSLRWRWMILCVAFAAAGNNSNCFKFIYLERGDWKWIVNICEMRKRCTYNFQTLIFILVRRKGANVHRKGMRLSRLPIDF